MARVTVAAPGAKLLVVEDDRDIAESLAALLADEGYRVETAPDGVAASAQARAAPPDAILLDLMLPLLDGVGVAEELARAGLGLAKVPIILLSAGQELATGAKKIGTPYVLRKPFELDDLLKMIDRALAERGA